MFYYHQNNSKLYSCEIKGWTWSDFAAEGFYSFGNGPLAIHS